MKTFPNSKSKLGRICNWDTFFHQFLTKRLKCARQLDLMGSTYSAHSWKPLSWAVGTLGNYLRVQYTTLHYSVASISKRTLWHSFTRIFPGNPSIDGILMLPDRKFVLTCLSSTVWSMLIGTSLKTSLSTQYLVIRYQALLWSVIYCLNIQNKSIASVFTGLMVPS